MELKEIKDVIFELTHIKDEEGNDVPHFCFATDISTDTEETEKEIAVIEAKDGYSIYEVFPGETMMGGLVILADGASIDLVKDMYNNFYGEAPEIAKMELNDDDQLVEVEDFDSAKEKVSPMDVISKDEQEALATGEVSYDENGKVITEWLQENLEDKIRKALDHNGSQINLFEVDKAEDWCKKSYDDEETDFSHLICYDVDEEERMSGKPVASFMISGGENGSGNWDDYLDDLRQVFNKLRDTTGYSPVLDEIETDIPDDVWTGFVYLYDKAEYDIQESVTMLAEALNNKDKPEVVTRDLNAAAMWGRTRSKVELPKKGKGSFKRHDKHKGNDDLDEDIEETSPDFDINIDSKYYVNGRSEEDIEQDLTFIEEHYKERRWGLELYFSVDRLTKYQRDASIFWGSKENQFSLCKTSDLSKYNGMFTFKKAFKLLKEFPLLPHEFIRFVYYNKDDDYEWILTRKYERPIQEDSSITASLDEAKKKKDNELKARARKHKKTDKKGAMGWFVHPNVETSIQAFNHAMGSADAPSTITAPAGLGEDIEEEPIKESEIIAFEYKLITDYREIGYSYKPNGDFDRQYYYNRVPETCYVVEKKDYAQDSLLRKRKNRRVLNGVKQFFSEHPKANYCVITAWDVSRGEEFAKRINTYRVLAADKISDYFVLRNKKFPKESLTFAPTEKKKAISEYYKKEKHIGWELVQIKEGKETKLYPNPEDNMLEAVEKHDTLNPKLWDEGGNLKPEVREKILEIVKEFTDGLEEDEIKFKIKDIIICGSNCSYNYNEMSDLDVHIRMDTKSLECPDNLYPLLYSAYRSLFNKKFDIDFYGIPVEIYVETDDTVDMNDIDPANDLANDPVGDMGIDN